MLIPVVALAGLLGCDDPAGVGLDLVGETGGDPVRIHLTPSSVASYDAGKVTGAVRGASAFSGQIASTLVGRVDDPLFGERAAEGYLDFQFAQFFQSFADNPVAFAEMRLVQTYVYGDTASVSTLQLFEMPDPWSPTGATFDTTFSFGPPILEVEYRPSDSLIVIPLPQSWIDTYDATLRSEDFNDLFHGFHLKTGSAEAVTGFSAINSSLRLGNSADTLTLGVSKLFTHIDVLREAAPTPDRVLIQDGVGVGLSLDLDFEPDTLENGALSRAVLQVHADTMLLEQELPPTFVRPRLVQLNLFGETPDGVLDFLLSAILNEEGRFDFESIDLNSEGTFIRSLQQRLFGEQTYERYVLLPPSTASTLSLMPVYALQTGENEPEAILTVVPLQ